MTKPTKNKVRCLELGRNKMLFESKSKADRFIKFNEEEVRKLELQDLKET